MAQKSKIKRGDKLEVYRNLHKKCFSVRRKGKVIEYVYDSGMHRRRVELYLINAQFVVQPAGRERVRREKRKNVHAFVRGTAMPFGGLQRKTVITHCTKKITYNPYTMDTFQDLDGNAVTNVKEVYISQGAVYIRW